MEAVKGRLPSALLIAYDLRGHGQSTGPVPASLDIDGLCQDALRVAHVYLQQHPRAPLVLVGHSLGGSIASRVAAALGERVLGLVVIDIVEETALAALRHMPALLAARPRVFPSDEAAIRWALHTRTCRSQEAAQLSFLAQYHRQQPTGQLEGITDLRVSEPHWAAWFTGLSQIFLALPVSRMLVLAETDYLDKALLIGQMQGRFQLEIVRDTGHAIQEDQPEQLAEMLATFVKRNLQVHLLNHPQ